MNEITIASLTLMASSILMVVSSIYFYALKKGDFDNSFFVIYRTCAVVYLIGCIGLLLSFGILFINCLSSLLS
jgi:hypothetical protein